MRFLGAGGKMGFGNKYDEVFIVGQFTISNFKDAVVSFPGLVVEFDQSTYKGIDLGYTPVNPQNLRELHVGQTSDDVYVISGTYNAGSIQKWDGNSWTTLGEVNNYPDDCVEDSNGNLYVSGRFTTIDGVTRTRVAKWDAAGATWGDLGSGLNNIVWACDVDENDDVYFGGQFLNAGGNVSADRIAKWNGSAWSNMGTGANNTVRAVVSDRNGNVYMGGQFTSPGTRVARWNGTAWSNLGSGVNNTVFAMATDSNGNLYVGGTFTTAGGSTANRIAKWNSSSSSWSAMGSGFNGGVYFMSVDANDNLYVTGNFNALGDGTSIGRVARWNGSTWVDVLDEDGYVDKEGPLDHDSSGKLYVTSNSNYNLPINFIYQPYNRFARLFRNNLYTEPNS